MKSFKHILILFLLAYSSLAFSISSPVSLSGESSVVDFSGHWVGTGTFSGVLGNGKPCSKVEITISQGPGTLTTEKYSAVCGLYQSDWGPDHMTIEGEKVIDQGEEIGTLKGNTLLTTEPQDGILYAFNLRLLPNGTLETYYGTKNGAGALVIEGTLQKVP